MIVRPQEVDGIRLHFNRIPRYNVDRLTPQDILNVLVTIRLYRYFSALPPETTQIEKDVLTSQIKGDDIDITKTRVARVLAAVLPYKKIGFQENARKSNGYVSRMWWRWQHPLEVTYGLEYFIVTTWLRPFLVHLNNEEWTVENIEGELEVFREMNEADEKEFISFIQEKDLYGAVWGNNPEHHSPEETKKHGYITITDENGQKWTQ